MARIYAVCSGQSPLRAFGRGSAKDWALRLSDDYYHLAPWWRSTNARGARVLFRSYEDAEKGRLKWEARGWPKDLTEQGIHPQQ